MKRGGVPSHFRTDNPASVLHRIEVDIPAGMLPTEHVRRAYHVPTTFRVVVERERSQSRREILRGARKRYRRADAAVWEGMTLSGARRFVRSSYWHELVPDYWHGGRVVVLDRWGAVVDTWHRDRWLEERRILEAGAKLAHRLLYR